MRRSSGLGPSLAEAVGVSGSIGINTRVVLKFPSKGEGRLKGGEVRRRSQCRAVVRV